LCTLSTRFTGGALRPGLSLLSLGAGWALWTGGTLFARDTRNRLPCTITIAVTITGAIALLVCVTDQYGESQRSEAKQQISLVIFEPEEACRVALATTKGHETGYKGCLKTMAQVFGFHARLFVGLRYGSMTAWMETHP
jgi:hypothetical protein